MVVIMSSDEPGYPSVAEKSNLNLNKNEKKSKMTNIIATVTHTEMKNRSACLPQHQIRMSLGCHCLINGTIDELWRRSAASRRPLN